MPEAGQTCSVDDKQGEVEVSAVWNALERCLHRSLKRDRPPVVGKLHSASHGAQSPLHLRQARFVIVRRIGGVDSRKFANLKVIFLVRNILLMFQTSN